VAGQNSADQEPPQQVRAASFSQSYAVRPTIENPHSKKAARIGRLLKPERAWSAPAIVFFTMARSRIAAADSGGKRKKALIAGKICLHPKGFGCICRKGILYCQPEVVRSNSQEIARWIGAFSRE